MELGLPDIKGMEVLRQTKEKHPDLSVLIITAFDEEDVKQEAKHLGAGDFMVKSYSKGCPIEYFLGKIRSFE